MNRRTEEDVVLGDDILLKKGTYCGYNGYTTNRDTAFWGPDSHEFRPSRWGQTTDDIQSLFRKASSKSAFISFHGGRRTCLGIKFAMTGARISIAKLLLELQWKLDPTWPNRMTPVSFSSHLGMIERKLTSLHIGWTTDAEDVETSAIKGRKERCGREGG